jgi:hypothetical protein
VALAAVSWFSLTAPYGLELRDEGRILARSQRVLEGALPNRDFSDVYGPGVSAVNALLLDLFDRRIVAVRWSLVALKTAAVVAVWLAACEVASVPIAAIATTFAILSFGRASWNLNTPYAALYVITLALVALALVLRAYASGRAWLAGAAGLAIGTAVLFKHSLAAMYATSLGLSLVAAMLLDPTRPRAEAGRLALSALFAALLTLSLVAHQIPLALVGLRDYLLFFFPAHALGLLVLMAPPHAGGEGGRLGLRALVAAGAGLLVVPAAVAALYASKGALVYAVSDIGRWPGVLINYAFPIGLPTAFAVALLAVVVALAGTGLLALRGRWRAAGLCAAVAGVAAFGATASGGEATILSGLELWGHSLHSLLAYALLAVCVPALRRPDRPAWLVPAVIVALFHHATGFQIFPRAGFNVLHVQPALAPALAVVGAAVWRGLELDALAGLRRVAVYACLAVPVLALALPAAVTVVELRRAPSLPIPFPETAGLAVRADAADEVLAAGELVTYLERAAPDAPLLLLNNDAMIPFLAHRRPVFWHLELVFQLMGDGMLPRAAVPRSDLNILMPFLKATPDALVLVKDEWATKNLRDYLPGLAEYLDGHFEPVFTAGPYAVLRQRPLRSRRPAPPA